jgi:exosortase/archaeosortase family protein
MLGLFNIETYTIPGFVVRIVDGTGVTIAMDCVGYGVMSFWAAYVIASGGAIKRMLVWTFAGMFLLWFINVIRISLLLVAYNKHWSMPFGIDHHTWFNIVAYIAIFAMMYFFEGRFKAKANSKAMDRQVLKSEM